MMVQIIPRVIFTLPSTISAMRKIICLIIFSARFCLTLSSDGHQLDTLAGDEVQGFVDIGNFVEPGKLQNYHYHLPVRS